MFNRFLSIVLLLVAIPAGTARGEIQWHELADGSGSTLEYAVVLPDDFDGTESYPVLLALPPGAQDRAMVEAGLNRYWGAQAAAAGWIVVSPAVSSGPSFTNGAWRELLPLIDHVQSSFNVEGKLHLAGASNGGLAAFLVAGRWPERFISLTALPGYPPPIWDEVELARLGRMPVRLFVGGDDTRWLQRMERGTKRLRDAGVDVKLDVLPGEGHVPESLDGGVVMTHLRGIHADLRRSDRPLDAHGRIFAVLDRLHRAAARAEERVYFGCFAPGAVFLGTDAGERWSLAEFRAYAHERFAAGRGWTYAVTARHVTISPGGRTAWFDEMLKNDRLGVCRGSGVLVQQDGDWKIMQYNLSIPIPNDLADDVAKMIRDGAD